VEIPKSIAMEIDFALVVVVKKWVAWQQFH
jgi:hypothetical protein